MNLFKFGTISQQYKLATASAPRGEAVYTEPGTYTWVAPDGVTSVSVVAIGGGGGGAKIMNYAYNHYYAGGEAGGKGWINDYTVTPGNSYTVVVGSGGAGYSVGFVWDITGDDGNDSYFINTSTVAGFGGDGGYAHDTNGEGGSGEATYVGDNGVNGNDGTAGEGSSSTSGGTGYSLYDSNGGTVGSGGNSNDSETVGINDGNNGAVYIVWGDGRAFPSTDVGLTE
jgi:hypothetical protein